MVPQWADADLDLTPDVKVKKGEGGTGRKSMPSDSNTEATNRRPTPNLKSAFFAY